MCVCVCEHFSKSIGTAIWSDLAATYTVGNKCEVEFTEFGGRANLILILN